MPVTLKHLRYFDALARHGHFGRAAEACFVTQPALSMQVQDLERTLGVSLIERARGGLMLTAEGQEIARRAARVLAETDALEVFGHHCRGILAGRLRFGVIPSIAPYILPPLLATLTGEYPALEVHVRESQTRLLLEELGVGKLDVLLMALPPDGSDLACLRLFNDPFFLAVPASRQLSGRVRASAELIAGERLLLLEEGHCLREQALDYCTLQQVKAVDTFGVSSLATVAGLVAAGQGITLLPQMCLATETAGRAITIVPFDKPEPSRSICLVWRASSPRSEDFHELGRMICETRADKAR